jgi:hypothetical protein
MLSDQLRDALHTIYLGLFCAHRDDPVSFSYRRLTIVMSALMGLEVIGWRVVGITPSALEKFSETGFKYVKGTFCQGHIQSRADTARFLFERSRPMNAEEFITEFLARDRTVLMLKAENALCLPFPNFIAIDNPTGQWFPNGSMGWKHRPADRAFLRDLYQKHRGN